MILEFKKHIENKFPFLLKGKVLIAISGGVDSVVLTHLMYHLNSDMALAHVNFQLRGKDSDEDEIFVQKLAKKLQVPFYVHRSDTEKYTLDNKLSIQMAAREIRYQWFEELLSEKGYDYILTAHHLDDVIESFFINLSRGTGLDGLTGIPEINTEIIRPLLNFDREQIVQYAKNNTLQWREDASNASTKYLRNKIRHDLIPILKDINPQYKETFVKTQKHLKDSQSLLSEHIEGVKNKLIEKKEDVIYLSINKLKKLSNTNAILYEILKDYNFTAWQDIYELVEAQSGKQILSNTHRLLKNRDFLLISPLNIGMEDKELTDIHDTFRFNNQDFIIEHKEHNTSINFEKNNRSQIFLDAAKIQFPLTLRKWQEGDYFYPLGMKGKKKLSNFFTDQKLSLLEKEKIRLLCDANKHILWIVGYRMDNRFKITTNTTKIIKISPKDEKNI